MHKRKSKKKIAEKKKKKAAAQRLTRARGATLGGSAAFFSKKRKAPESIGLSLPPLTQPHNNRMCAYGKRSRPPVGAPQEVKNALFSNFADKNSRIFGSSHFLSYLCSDIRGTCRKGPRSSTRGTASQSIRDLTPIHTTSGAGVIISAAQRDWNSSTHSPHPKQRCSTPCWDATQRGLQQESHKGGNHDVSFYPCSLNIPVRMLAITPPSMSRSVPVTKRACRSRCSAERCGSRS